jgi:DNA-binding transcriptional ArsR family regulator
MVSIVSVKPVVFDLGEIGKVLATRERGREAGRAAADRLVGAPAMILGFWGVEVASPPFIDEFLRALRAELSGGESSRLLVAAGANEDVRESLLIVLERQGSSLATLERDHIELLGGSRQLRETLKEAQELGYFTASELAERLKVKLPNLHARLKALTEVGAVAREDAGGERPSRGGTARAFRAGDVDVLKTTICAG